MGLLSGLGGSLKTAWNSGSLLSGLNAAQSALNGDYGSMASSLAAQRRRDAEEQDRQRAYKWATSNNFSEDEARILASDPQAMSRAVLSRPRPAPAQPPAPPTAPAPGLGQAGGYPSSPYDEEDDFYRPGGVRRLFTPDRFFGGGG